MAFFVLYETKIKDIMSYVNAVKWLSFLIMLIVQWTLIIHTYVYFAMKVE